MLSFYSGVKRVHRDPIELGFLRGRNAMTIWQDLVDNLISARGGRRLTASVQALDYLRDISVPKLKLNHKLEDLHMEEHGRTTPARFALGRIVATPGALGALEEAGQTPIEFLARHALGDWGEL